MRTLAQSVYLDAQLDTPTDLPRVGSALENPHVFDASAKELKAMAASGLVEILDERRYSPSSQALICALRFKRMR